MDGEQAPSRSHTNSPHPGSLTNETEPKAESSFNSISNEETIRRLRSKGQPIRLFAESDKDRRLRLRALELIEEKGHDRQGGQNDFKKALEDVENVERDKNNKNSKGKKKDESEVVGSDVLDLSLVKSDPDKVYPLIYYALKRVLKEWGEAMDARPGMSVRTIAWTVTYNPLIQSISNAQRRENWPLQPRCNQPRTLSRCSSLFAQE